MLSFPRDGVEGFVVRLEGKEIAKAVEKILQIENNYTEIASHTIKKAENFDWDILSTELLLSYKKLL